MPSLPSHPRSTINPAGRSRQAAQKTEPAHPIRTPTPAPRPESPSGSDGARGTRRRETQATDIDSVGQTSTQAPQSPQVSSSTTATPSWMEMASRGQASAHSPQPEQVSELTTAAMNLRTPEGQKTTEPRGFIRHGLGLGHALKAGLALRAGRRGRRADRRPAWHKPREGKRNAQDSSRAWAGEAEGFRGTEFFQCRLSKNPRRLSLSAQKRGSGSRCALSIRRTTASAVRTPIRWPGETMIGRRL